VVPRGTTVILETPQGKRFRLCRKCYTEYEMGKLKQDFDSAKKTIDLYGITGTDAYEITDKKKKFVEDIKEGKWENIL